MVRSSASGGFAPDPIGASPLDLTGGLLSPMPLNFATPEIIPGYATVNMN